MGTEVLGEGLPKETGEVLDRLFVARITTDEMISQESSQLCLLWFCNYCFCFSP